jgi:Holliday junction resolvase-like predicted endonuclease
MPKVSNEKKNLHRLAGEFLVASRLTQRGYRITLQWGSTIGYDVLVFDKKGNVAFLEVKSTASFTRRWVLQKKYANPQSDLIPLKKRFCLLRRSFHHERGTSDLRIPSHYCRKGLALLLRRAFSQ